MQKGHAGSSAKMSSGMQDPAELSACCLHGRCGGLEPGWGSLLTKAICALQMSMHECVFYYWSDEQWDSCDKFREAAMPILNPTGIPNLLEWRASGTQVCPLPGHIVCL